ncbi:MAG: hypothetical protein B6243_12990 [Anaerolineaceae bacterium 4572_5.2]|nr:MAG: hypothetical protein B6243_12990 [Anaerolineaceae bacterium 4572_5.2]
MPGHWLYRYFPELPALERISSQTPSEIYVVLQEQAFTVKMTQQTYYQPVAYGAALKMAKQRETSPILLRLNDSDYLTGLKRLEKDVEGYSDSALLPSHICVSEIVSRRSN